MRTPVLTIQLSWRTLGLLGVAAILAISLFLTLRPASAVLSGTIKGHAFTVGGTVVTTELPSQQRVDLPPGGEQSSGPIDQGVPGVFNFHADSADTQCDGSDSGDSVNANCSADIHGVLVTAGGQKVFTADRLFVVSNSADTGGGAHSDADGTTYDNLCVFTTLLSQCQVVGPDSNVPINNLLLSGGIEIDHREPRSSDTGTEGSGLNVTGVKISLTVAGQGLISIDIARADSFVGGVIEDNDQDDDGINDDDDNCPVNANPEQTDTDDDGIGDVCDPDDDNDGIGDGDDNCPVTSNHEQTNTDGDAQGDACDPDDDNDGVPDGSDNCRIIVNPDQLNTDGDDAGDACDSDDDNDGIGDHDDNCPVNANPEQTDTDNDGKGNACDPDDDNDGVPDGDDNCPLNANANQEDTDNDGIGNACDPDDDNDGIPDGDDNCPITSNPGQEDSDGDGLGDVCDNTAGDPDSDGDGIPDSDDNCPTTPNHNQLDTDHDGTGNECDNDSDNDGIPDTDDNCPLTPNPDQADEDDNGVGDVCQHEDNPMFWGDVNCDGEINVMDALAIILYGVDYPYGKTDPCPDIGDEVHVSGFN